MQSMILGNRYEIIEKIGGGGMAVVYKAKCRLLNRYVAVKVLRDEFTNDDEFVKRFRIEAQSAASLSHPNIVSIFDVGQQDNVHYIVMEYVDGITLKQYIDEKKALEWNETVGIGVQICSAIEHAHKNKIIHRDIKPHNILLTQEGIAKVTDFGIARAVSSSTITMEGSTVGSVHYFSPEQARGGLTDEKSDLYSIGVTLYEMVTGKVPFIGESPVAVALQHIQDEPESPVKYAPGIPVGLNQIIVRAIKKDKALRYDSANELLTDLLKVARNPEIRFNYPEEYSEQFATRKMNAIGATTPSAIDVIKTARPNKPESGKGSKEEHSGKRDKMGLIFGVITGIVIIGILLFIGLKVLIPAITPENTDFIVQDYVGRDFSEVEAELREFGINAVEDKRVYSDKDEAGIIISQYPDKDKTLKVGSTVEFVISNGEELVAVPDVFMRETRLAQQMLKNEGFETTVISENSETVPKGVVIRTEPNALTKVEPGEKITIVESLGIKLEKVKVPSLEGLTQVNAEKRIVDNNLVVGLIMPLNLSDEKATVESQFPAAGTEVDEGSVVDLTFKTSESATETPNGKYIARNIELKIDNPANFGDEILVYVEATPSDTNKLTVVMNKKVRKSGFPLLIEILVPRDGSTHVVARMDGMIIVERDMTP